MVSSHVDLKPDNMLFDGERVWLVDWQAGFANDRYFPIMDVTRKIDWYGSGPVTSSMAEVMKPAVPSDQG